MPRLYDSPAWKAIRRAALIRDHWRCVACNRSLSAKGQSRVDHIKPLSTHPHLALSLANLRSLCPRCDNQSHREKGLNCDLRITRFSGCDRYGMPIDRTHHWHAADRTF
jgi:5-methylcytosine-specific restriction endonuclease McrA